MVATARLCGDSAARAMRMPIPLAPERPRADDSISPRRSPRYRARRRRARRRQAVAAHIPRRVRSRARGSSARRSLAAPLGNSRCRRCIFSPKPRSIVATQQSSKDALEQNARLLEGVLEDFGVKGEIIHVRPGPVVTLYELEPAPGIKSSRVIGLADDIARSMSAISARVAVVPGRNAIGIELPNAKRETVYLRELLGIAAISTIQGQARAGARQDDQRRAGHRRPRQDAASARRRHHRLGQIGGHQHDDPVAALPAEAGGVPADHDRSEDAGALRL